MRFLAISDLHGFLPQIEVESDVLLVAGDLVPDNFIGQEWHSKSAQGYWLKNTFSDWCEKAPAKHVVVIAGNHDIVIMNNPGIMKDVNCTYLQDEATEIEGFKIHGTPWTPTFGNWAFMKKDENLFDRWNKIDDDTDILISHGPPKGFCDGVEAWVLGNYEAAGSQTLRDKVSGMSNLKLNVFGHIHEGYGKVDHFGKVFANVSHVNSNYDPVNNPMFFEVTK